MSLFQDIHLSDNALRNQYADYCAGGQYQQALTILSSNPQLATKVFNAETLNVISEALYQEESNAYNGINAYLNQKSELLNTLIGQVLNRQQWSSAIEYSLFNFVIYNESVYMYVNATPSSGNLPTNTVYWLNVGLKGTDGANGADLVLRYQWSASESYLAKDLVWYNDKGWVALRNNTNKAPGSFPQDWEEFISSQKASIQVYNQDLTQGYNGQIYIKIN